MNNDLLLGARRLTKGRILRVHHALGHRVECVSGSLWITQDGDPRDFVLEPGEGLAFDRPGDALVSAFADSHFLLLDAETSPSRKPAY